MWGSLRLAPIIIPQQGVSNMEGLLNDRFPEEDGNYYDILGCDENSTVSSIR